MQLSNNTELQGGKYRIVRVLGQGGFGITYLAEHTMLDKMVAIKEFFPREYCDRDENTSHLTVGTKNSVEIVDMLKTKFIKEAKNISKLNHRNIITIHDIFQENETAYYVMEYVEGASLSQKIKEQGAMPEDKALGYIRKIADAVGYMHSLSMNHLDLKPANIMVRVEDDEPILIDFGLSKQYDASGGQTSTTPVGISHGFAPIEQYRPGGVSSFTPQTDIYALGATLYNLLSGTVPPHYSEILEDGLPELPAAISQRTADAVEHAMEIKKNKRPATILELLKELGEHISIAKLINSANRSVKESDYDMPQREETMIIDSYEQDVQGIGSSIDDAVWIDSSDVEQPMKYDEMTIYSNIDFVDLGLSVKWASSNLGAEFDYQTGTYYYRTDVLIPSLLSNTDEVCVPSIQQIEELIKCCDWYWTKQSIGNGYKIIGPNGNNIFLPACGLSESSLSTFYGVYWSKESIAGNSIQMLYINDSMASIENYAKIKNCPIRLISK